MKRTVYVCYEENNHDLAIEIGLITDLTVFCTADKALVWFQKRVAKGIESGFIIDSEDDALTEENVLYVQRVKDKIEKGYASVTMFFGHQEHWDVSYDIVVEAKEIDDDY